MTIATNMVCADTIARAVCNGQMRAAWQAALPAIRFAHGERIVDLAHLAGS